MTSINRNGDMTETRERSEGLATMHNEGLAHQYVPHLEIPPLPKITTPTVGEARLILPWQCCDAARHTLVLDVEERLRHLFGSYTRFHAAGSYVMRDGKPMTEQVLVYDIAVTNISATYQQLREIAEHIRVAAEQESVYLRLPNGQVEFV